MDSDRTSTRHSIKLTVNGTQYQLEVESRRLLVDVLRYDFGLTGTHVGCEQGVCGNCTVILNGQAINSCLMFAVQADGAEIETVEGLASGYELHALQNAFQEHFALQCGYCTPGVLMNALDMLRKNPNPSLEEISEGVAGNMCRCGGYENIVNAIRSASMKMSKRDED